MANFLTALIRQRNEARKSADTGERFMEIVAILNKYDYNDGITPQIVTSILEDLGPTFVKIGQIASQQPETIPPEYCDALSKLRSSVAPMDIETVNGQIEKYLGASTDTLFATFDEKPLGSASIGQVHKATLEDGTAVAVKVRRPGIVETVARDFALFEKAIDFNLKFIKDKGMGSEIAGMLEELERTSKLELDFTNEANNLNRFYENNEGRNGVASPKCYTDLTCEAILTEDFVEGQEASDASFLESLGDDEREHLAKTVADSFATQVLVDGFYHADPHSGNVLIRPMETALSQEGADEDVDKTAPSLGHYGTTWIDFGMMGTISATQQKTLGDLVGAVLKHDPYNLKRIVLKVASPRGEIDHGALLEQCEAICDQSDGKSLTDFSLGDLFSMMLDTLQDANYRIEPYLTNLSRGVIAAEGTVKTISPNVNILNCFLDKVDTGFSPESLDVEETLSTVLMKALKGLEGGTELPAKAIEALDMLEKGQITVHGGMNLEEKSLKHLDHIVRNCALAAMSIAIFIGSCILCLISDPGVTRVMGIPAFGFVGYLFAIGCMWYVVIRMGKDE